MQIIEEIKSQALEKHLKITIPSLDVEKKYQDKISEIQAMARIPGYRPGKAPSWLVLKQFGESVYDEVVKDAIEESVKEALKDLKIAESPDLEDLVKEKGKDLSFILKFEILPEITLPNFQAIKIEKPTFQVTQKDIEADLARVVEGYTTYDTKEGVAEEIDGVMIDISGSKADGESFPQKEIKEVLFRLDKDLSLSKKFNDALIGCKAGDELKFDIDYPKDFENKSLAEQKVAYCVKVHSVRKASVPELNDELAKTAGYESLEALKQDLIKAKELEYDTQVSTVLSIRLFDALDELLTFDVPKSTLEKEVKGISSEMESLKKDDTDLSDKSEEEIRQYAEKFAYRRVRIGMVLQEYAAEKDLKVDFDDIKKAVVKRVSMFPEYMQQEMLNWYYKSPQNLQSISGSALEQKIVEHILSHAGLQVSEKAYALSEILLLVEQETEKKMY